MSVGDRVFFMLEMYLHISIFVLYFTHMYGMFYTFCVCVSYLFIHSTKLCVSAPYMTNVFILRRYSCALLLTLLYDLHTSLIDSV